MKKKPYMAPDKKVRGTWLRIDKPVEAVNSPVKLLHTIKPRTLATVKSSIQLMITFTNMYLAYLIS